MKKEAYDAAMVPQDADIGPVAVVGRKKRQRQTQAKANAPNKRRKTVVSEGRDTTIPCAGGYDPAGMAPASVSSLDSGVLHPPGNDSRPAGHSSETAMSVTNFRHYFDTV